MSEEKYLKDRPFTVADMKKALEGMSDDTQIVIGCDCSEWLNLAQEYEVPNEEAGYLALTFFTRDTFDARQF